MSNNKSYSVIRQERTRYANDHTALMQEKYGDKIKYSIDNTIKFDNNNKDVEVTLKLIDNCSRPKIYLWDVDTVEALYRTTLNEYNMSENTAVLNFASFKYPGGGFIVGTNAQEENLCQESFLYNVLKEFDSTWYEWNRNHTNKSLYMNRGLYSKNIRFEKHNKELYADVITVASPNKNAYDALDDTTDTIDYDENYKALKDRIGFILNIANAMHVENIILGAFGCGVFKQDAAEVAQIFKEYIDTYDYGFKSVIYAIPDKDGNNYKTFENIIECEVINAKL